MNYKKMKKAMAVMFTSILAVTVTSTSIPVYAASTTTSTKSSNITQGANQAPPGGAVSGSAPSGAPPAGGGGAGGGSNTMSYDYTGTLSGALTASKKSVTSKSKTYSTSTADQNAALVQNAGTLKITKGTLTKSGDDTNGDNCNFYGLNSILLAVNSDSKAYISDSTLSADSEGSNGIFSTDNATVYANNDTITTTAGNSRGLDATYGGTIIANKLTISTKGEHCASIATDRGGGNISVTNSKLSTAGSGSPLLYSTGNIEVDNITGTATGSQIAGMEGLNTIMISNSTLTSTNTSKTASDPIADGIIIYQSTSGDAESTTGSTATFQAVDSTLKSAIASGAMFYFTNTTAKILLSNTKLDFDSSKANLLTVQGNDANNWGTAGSNGADIKFTGLNETLSGNIDVDTISSLNMYLLKNSTYTGATTISTNATNTDVSSAPITMNLDSTSKWVVTADSTVTNLNVEKGASIVDENGKTVSIVADGKTVVSGKSSIKITVTGAYKTSVTTDSSNQISSANVDRSAFDKYYGVTTTFNNNGTSATGAASEDTTATTSAASNSTSSTSTNSDNNTILYGIAAAFIIVLGGGTVFWFKKKKK